MYSICRRMPVVVMMMMNMCLQLLVRIIGGVPEEMIIDSGASVNVISQASWEQLKKCHIKCVLQQNTKRLYAYRAVSPLEVIGTFTADITMGNNQ